MTTKNNLLSAHKYSSNHKSKLINDNICGCFYCLKIFNPNEITEWIEDSLDGTAICPYCEIDSIIGESSGFLITQDFLQEMYDCWFER